MKVQRGPQDDGRLFGRSEESGEPLPAHLAGPNQVKADLRGSDSEQALTFERHLSVEELAALWGMSEDFVRRLFLKEPGVVVFFNHQPGKRVYRTLRIPESVARRVHRRMIR
jgi:hypothetical protein